MIFQNLYGKFTGDYDPHNSNMHEKWHVIRSLTPDNKENTMKENSK